MNSEESNIIEIHRRIHLGAMLGEGSMGRVLDGFASDLGQPLAVKELLEEWRDDQDVRARFKEEAAIMASINHPGVLPVYGIGRDSGKRLGYVMKKVEGETLAQVLQDSQEFLRSVPRRNRLLSILLKVAETMASAHDKGIIHRDVKPENILIDRERSVYVIDWGIAKRTGTAGASARAERTLPGKVMGTPGYMAPEQADGHSSNAGAEADVFALGVILYEILTGKRPFAANDNRAEMLGSIHQDPEQPKKINVLLPRDICAICMKALEKNPGARYPNARGLADDIRAHLEGRAVEAIRPNVIERIQHGARQRPMRALVIASLSAALGILVMFILGQRWAEHRIEKKAMERVEMIDMELAELEKESEFLISMSSKPDLEKSDLARIHRELEIIDSRWLIAQFEAFRLLSSISELRFVRMSSEIQALTRERLLSVVSSSIERGKPAIGEALISTILEREAEGTLSMPFPKSDIELLKRMAVEVSRTPRVKDH